jgi:hypothetical protein
MSSEDAELLVEERRLKIGLVRERSVHPLRFYRIGYYSPVEVEGLHG